MLAHGTTFTFKGSTFSVTSIRVQAPQAEIVDITPMAGAAGAVVMLETGEHASPGSVEIEFIGSGNPASMVRQRGQLVISGSAGGLTKNAICENATQDAKVSDIVRGSARFVLTDYE